MVSWSLSLIAGFIGMFCAGIVSGIARAAFDQGWHWPNDAGGQRVMDVLQWLVVFWGASSTFVAVRALRTDDKVSRDGGLKQLLKAIESDDAEQVVETAVRVLLHRLRQRFRETLRGELAQTLVADADVDAEMQHLFEALRAR